MPGRQLIVRASKGKRPRAVPLNQKTIEVLTPQREKYLRQQWVFPGGPGGYGNARLWTLCKPRSEEWWNRISLRDIREKIPAIVNLPKGRTGRGWHIMRHTFATRAARA